MSWDIPHSQDVVKMHWQEFGRKRRRERVAGSWGVWANSDSEFNSNFSMEARSLQPFTGSPNTLSLINATPAEQVVFR